MNEMALTWDNKAFDEDNLIEFDPSIYSKNLNCIYYLVVSIAFDSFSATNPITSVPFFLHHKRETNERVDEAMEAVHFENDEVVDIKTFEKSMDFPSTNELFSK